MTDVTSSQDKQSRVGSVTFGVLEFGVDFGTPTAAATTKALDITGWPSGAINLHTELCVQEYFTGGAITAVTAQVGDAGDPNALVAALNVWDTTTIGSWSASTAGVEDEYGSTGPGTPVTAPQILFTSTSADLDALTAGKLRGRIHYKLYHDN